MAQKRTLRELRWRKDTNHSLERLILLSVQENFPNAIDQFNHRLHKYLGYHIRYKALSIFQTLLLKIPDVAFRIGIHHFWDRSMKNRHTEVAIRLLFAIGDSLIDEH